MNKEKEQLCPICRTGFDMLMLDKRELFCPYMYLNNGDCCSKFVKIENMK